MNCPKCWSSKVNLDYPVVFNCGTIADGCGNFHHTAFCTTIAEFRDPFDSQILKLESEGDALKARVKRLEEAGDNLAHRLKLWKVEDGWLHSGDEEAFKDWQETKEFKP